MTTNTITSTRMQEPVVDQIEDTTQRWQTTDGCVWASFEAQVDSFYGDSAVILKNLKALPLDVRERRLYMFLLETKGRAELLLFERVDENNCNVWRWSGEEVKELKFYIEDMMLANRGISCVGEQAKSIIGEMVSLKEEGSIPAPVSAYSAFAHTVKKYDNHYMRVSAFGFC